MNKRGFGHIGECSAALYLEKEGYRIIGKNIYVGKCELDIVAVNDTHIIFVEVKTRRQYPNVKSIYGRPALAVNERKRQNMLTAAGGYLREHKTDTENLMVRLDIIEVYVDPADKNYRVIKIEHFKGAVHG